MSKKQEGILIAVLTGWFGGYRFYKRQYLLGVVYLCTGGLLGVGWLVDIIKAVRGCSANSENINTVQSNRADIITEFHTRVVGVVYPCVQGPHDTRQEALGWLRLKDKLRLDYFEYEGEPAYRVVNSRNGGDIGNLKAELSKELYRKYKDCNIEIKDFDVTGGDGKNYGCNLLIRISRKNNQF